MSVVLNLYEIDDIKLGENAALLIPIDKIPAHRESEIVTPDQMDRFRCGVVLRSVDSGGSGFCCENGDIVIFKTGSGSSLGVFTEMAEERYKHLGELGLRPVRKLLSMDHENIIAVIGNVSYHPS